MSPLIETTAQSVERLANELSRAVEKLTIEAQILIGMNKCDQPEVCVIQALVCEHLGLPLTVMFSAVRTNRFAYARHLAMWLCRELTEHTYAAIGGWFGGRDHGTVKHAIKAMNARRETEHRARAEMEQLLEAARQRITRLQAAA